MLTMIAIKKLLVVGDEGCGKTSLLTEFLHKVKRMGEQVSESLPSDEAKGTDLYCQTCVPSPPPGFVTFFSPVTCGVEVDGKWIEFTVEEAPSQEHYSMLRQIVYEDKDVIVLCFSLIMPNSLENILRCWLPEIKQYCPNATIILVGNKVDLQNDHILKSTDGRAVAKRIGAFSYVECSAVSKKGVCEVFETALRGAL